LSNLSNFIKSTIEFLQSRSSRCSAASLTRIASTSAFEIGVAAVAPGAAAVPAGLGDAAVADDEGGGEGGPAGPTAGAAAPPAGLGDAAVADDEGGGEGDPAAPVAGAACLEPKIADTMLPKTLISSSYVCCFSPQTGVAASKSGCEH